VGGFAGGAPQLLGLVDGHAEASEHEDRTGSGGVLRAAVGREPHQLASIERRLPVVGGVRLVSLSVSGACAEHRRSDWCCERRARL
jgi:hypothetical protein